MYKVNFIKFALALSAMLTIGCIGCIESKIEDTPAQRKALAIEAAQLMLNSGGFDAIMEISVEQGTQIFTANMQTSLGRELTRSEYEKCRRAFSESFKETYPAQAWESPFADLYAKHFNSNDLTQLLAFYKTETGTKFLRAQGTLTKDGADLGIKLVESKQEEFMKTFDVKLTKYAK